MRWFENASEVYWGKANAHVEIVRHVQAGNAVI